jgi:hypothetical protein
VTEATVADSSAEPGAPGGTITVHVVVDEQLTEPAVTDPNSKLVPPEAVANPEPVTVTSTFPVVGACIGETLVIVGAATGGMTFSTWIVLSVPIAAVTVGVPPCKSSM